jgi:hypothetical protein
MTPRTLTCIAAFIVLATVAGCRAYYTNDPAIIPVCCAIACFALAVLSHEARAIEKRWDV